MGSRNGIPVSLFDIMAHELSHCYLLEFLEFGSNSETNALHEGIADIFGSYIENFTPPYQLDWITGDDVTDLAAFYN